MNTSVHTKKARKNYLMYMVIMYIEVIGEKDTVSLLSRIYTLLKEKKGGKEC